MASIAPSVFLGAASASASIVPRIIVILRVVFVSWSVFLGVTAASASVIPRSVVLRAMTATPVPEIVTTLCILVVNPALFSWCGGCFPRHLGLKEICWRCLRLASAGIVLCAVEVHAREGHNCALPDALLRRQERWLDHGNRRGQAPSVQRRNVHGGRQGLGHGEGSADLEGSLAKDIVVHGSGRGRIAGVAMADGCEKKWREGSKVMPEVTKCKNKFCVNYFC